MLLSSRTFPMLSRVRLTFLPRFGRIRTRTFSSQTVQSEAEIKRSKCGNGYRSRRIPDFAKTVGSRRDYSSTDSSFASLEWLPDATELDVRVASDSCHFVVRHEKHEMILDLPYLYLRDSCLCSECRHPVTKQRLVDTFTLPTDIQPRSWELVPDGLTVEWNDDHVSHYSREWFQARHKPLNAHELWLQRQQKWFDHQASLEPPSVSYESIMRTQDGLRDYLNLIAEYGFCFVNDCPLHPEATRDLLERIAFIRLTHYGGFYDFTADLSSKDTAYTNIALDLHNDNTYFSDPTGIQMLHLLSHEDGQGGLSTLADGFEVAHALRLQSEDDFNALHTTTINGHASGDTTIGSITPVARAEPVIGLSTLPASGSSEQSLHYHKIRWNNSDRATWSASKDASTIQAWYKAAKTFNSLSLDSKYLWQFQLEPGRPLIFDNWRMLHGRTAFTGKRRMAGGYINMDDFVARWKQLNLKDTQILESI